MRGFTGFNRDLIITIQLLYKTNKDEFKFLYLMLYKKCLAEVESDSMHSINYKYHR